MGKVKFSISKNGGLILSYQFVNSGYGDYGLSNYFRGHQGDFYSSSYPLGGHGYFPKVANATNAGAAFRMAAGNVVGGAGAGQLDGNCNIIAEGKFEDQPGVNGIAGAPWVLYDNGVLVVCGGYISWSTDDPWAWLPSPWFDYHESILEIVFTGIITAGASLANLFHGLHNVKAIEGLMYFDTSNVKSMKNMFLGMSSLRKLDVLSWDTSQVIYMEWMFSGASSLIELDVSTWDTSNVVNMSGMFSEMTSLRKLDVSTWDTKKVVYMSWMFAGTSSLRKLNVSAWNTSNVVDMEGMLLGMSSLRKLDVSAWDTSNVMNMQYMLAGMTSLRELTLGEQFRFTEMISLGITPSLPSIPKTDEFTGRWQNIGNGTVDSPTGEFALTSAQLTLLFNGATMSDTFVWQPVGENPFPIGEITQLAIDYLEGYIDQQERTITFTVSSQNTISETGGLRGLITALNADSNAIVFYSKGNKKRLSQGQDVEVRTGDLVYVECDDVYMIIIASDQSGSGGDDGVGDYG